MNLNIDKIRANAARFVKEWENVEKEIGATQSFWDEFFQIFGLDRKKIADYEKKVTLKEDQKNGFIDVLWAGVMLVEQKSPGKDLERAHTQAVQYYEGLTEQDQPQYIVVCNFERFRVYDLTQEEEAYLEFPLSDLVNRIMEAFGFMIGFSGPKYKDQEKVNIRAAYLMGKLHEALKANNYTGHELEVYLVRLLFCLFAEDTTIFQKYAFIEYIDKHTSKDGSDLGPQLAYLFEILNTPPQQRPPGLGELLTHLPYVNGALFAERLRIAHFSKNMRDTLLECCRMDWSQISPAIFGSMFQSVMEPEERRSLGAHYTSEENIKKVIDPLFLEGLYQEFEKVKQNKKQLRDFQVKLSKLRFLDPACGCGNFLVLAFRELRELELKVLHAIYPDKQQTFDIDTILAIKLENFYGMEYEEWPAEIAKVAMWLIDHQMNMKFSREFGQYYLNLPLTSSPNIKQCNALREDWEAFFPKTEWNYILGNPPFYGRQYQNEEQKADLRKVFGQLRGSGNLDYVTCWYMKTAQYLKNTQIEVAFVSTNSITQGEQVGTLWNELFNNYQIKINFAHQTFKWYNEGKGKAAVYCVIIGFSTFNRANKKLYYYKDLRSEPEYLPAANINPYLVEGGDIVVTSRSTPISNVPEILFGNMPNDGGNLLLNPEEAKNLLENHPEVEPFIKPFLSAKQFINGEKRYCIWLKDASPSAWRTIKPIMEKVKEVRKHRENSARKSTQSLAETPHLFGEIRQPKGQFILIPRVSSEARNYVPIGFFENGHIIGDTCLAISQIAVFHFGVLTSKMHMVWMRYTCGRLKGDYRYSNKIVYNNFPWPPQPTQKQIDQVKAKAQTVLDARANYPEASLADLYDPLTMPQDLLKAHQALDKAVDRCYRSQPFTNDNNRLEYLFWLYQQYTEGFFSPEKKQRTKRKKKH